MKWFSTFDHPEKIYFIIELDEGVGCYLYLYYEDASFFETDLLSAEGCPHHQDDYLQDTLQIAQRQAFEDFGVPPDSWRVVELSEKQA